MTVQLTPYLAFRDRTREAFDFYATVFGGTPTFSTFGEFGVGTPAEAEKVMHGQLQTPSGLLLMGADRPDSYPLEEASSVSLSLFGGPDDAAALTGWFDALAVGGTVHEALAQAPWGDSFGMLDDRYGQHWMVNIGGTAA
ncbi:PhnB protein [Frigoribacterium sp. PvP054]|uniref:VOC family protein n=1 Tax=Frigoribacterium sp. PvP054 TaxID=3156438 RepID=UPI003395FBCF